MPIDYVHLLACMFSSNELDEAYLKHRLQRWRRHYNAKRRKRRALEHADWVNATKLNRIAAEKARLTAEDETHARARANAAAQMTADDLRTAEGLHEAWTRGERHVPMKH